MAAVASRYARALADAVTGGKIAADAAAIETQLLAFQALMQESSDLRNVLISPAVPAVSPRRAGFALMRSPCITNDSSY